MSIARAIGVIVGSPTIDAPSLVSMAPAKMRIALLRFRQHRQNSRNRKVGFRFDFPTWIATWVESGVYHLRGRRRGEFVMARPHDQGDYEPGNVVFITTGDNVVECHTGKPFTETRKAKISAKAKARLREGSPGLAKLQAIRRSPRMRRLVSRNSKVAWARRRAEGVSP
jgi:hypothetical protein